VTITNKERLKMQVKIESLGKVKKKINFEIPAERVASEIDKVYEEIRKRASIKGFRKGKAPRSYIEKHYSAAMEEDVLKNLFNDTYFKALLDAKIYPVAHPVIESDELKKGEPFKYSATVEVYPEIEVKDYVGLEVKKEQYVQDDKLIEARLQQMRESMAQLKPAEEGHLAAMGDFATLDFTGFIAGEPFEHGAAEDFELELGSGRFIPGFEEQIAGMKAGDEGDITVTFPENYGSDELAGKEATFKIKIKEIKVKDLPQLDDELAKEFGEFETLDQVRAKLAEVHEKQEKERIESDLRERVVQALIGRNDLEVPEAMVEKQLQIMLDSTKKRLEAQKLSLEMMGLDEESYRVRFKGTAETQVKGGLLLDALAGKEGITVEDSDIDERLREIAAQHNQSFETLQQFYSQNENARGSLRAQLLEDKVIKFLVGKAQITEVTRDELTGEQKA
jgi:trigger factor